MNKLITWLLLGLFLASFLAGCAPAAAPTPPVVTETVVVPSTVVVPPTVVVPAPTSATAPVVAVGPVNLTVYNPTGAFQITQSFAPRVPDLNGKTVCEVGNAAWQVNRTFPLITSLLQKQFPTIKMVGHDQLPTLLIQQDIAGLEDAIKAKGCQAVIVGNAG